MLCAFVSCILFLYVYIVFKSYLLFLVCFVLVFILTKQKILFSSLINASKVALELKIQIKKTLPQKYNFKSIPYEQWHSSLCWSRVTWLTQPTDDLSLAACKDSYADLSFPPPSLSLSYLLSIPSSPLPLLRFPSSLWWEQQGEDSSRFMFIPLPPSPPHPQLSDRIDFISLILSLSVEPGQWSALVL